MSVLEYLTRAVDDKPMAAHLCVTDQGNHAGHDRYDGHDGHHPNAHDDGALHPELATLEQWMRKIRELGVSRLVFQGGEPLLHPDIVAITRYAKSLGFYRVSMASNALPLTKKMLEELERAGLDTFQISIDRATRGMSSEVMRKSLKSVQHKLEWFKDSKVELRVSDVLFRDSLEDATKVVDLCIEKGIAVHARVMHDDVHGVHDDTIDERKQRLHPSTGALLKAVEYQEALKRQGAPIHTSWSMLEYEKKMLRGEEMDWTCTAGYKYFFVSAKGTLWLCSEVRTEKHIMDVTPEDLRAHSGKKACQKGCGVSCIVDTSLGISHPAEYVAREAQGRLQGKLATLRTQGKALLASR